MPSPRFLRNFFFLITGAPGVRFRKFDKPTEATFKQLFDSTGFIKEKDDTAKTVDQGFVKIAQDLVVQSRNSTPDSDGFTKTVIPHQLPFVYKDPNFPFTGISVTGNVNMVNRTGGSGLDFFVRNTMAISSPDGSIVVTQNNPGENVLLHVNTLVLPLSKVKVNVNDPTDSYLEDSFESTTTCRLGIATRPDNEKLQLTYRDKVREMTMYSGTNVQFAIDFPGNIGMGCWAGWVMADGGTYANSSSIPVTVQDMRGVFPVGYFPAGLYPNIQSNVDSGALSGEISHSLTAAENGVHNHVISPITTSNAGSHTHAHYFGYDKTNDAGSQSSLNCGVPSDCTLETASAGDHDHTISGVTENSGNADAHENRPPFSVVAFVVYIG